MTHDFGPLTRWTNDQRGGDLWRRQCLQGETSRSDGELRPCSCLVTWEPGCLVLFESIPVSTARQGPLVFKTQRKDGHWVEW